MTNKTRSGYIPVKVGHNKKIKIFDRFTSVKKQSKRVLKTFFFNRKKESIGNDDVNISEIKNDRKKSEITKHIKEAKKIESQKNIIHKDASAAILPDDIVPEDSEKNINRKAEGISVQNLKPSEPHKKKIKLFVILVLVLLLIAITACFLIYSNVFNNAQIAISGIDKNKVITDKPVPGSVIGKINNTKVYFSPDSDKLLIGELTKLDLIVDHLNASSGDILIIMGHEHKVGQIASSGLLSKKRAVRIQNILLNRCSKKLNVKIEFFGNSKPAIINARTKDEKMQNRRVEFRIMASQ